MQAKLTRGQACVYDLLNDASDGITAHSIFTELQAQGKSLSLAMVYRAIKAMQWQGLVQARTRSNGAWTYRLVSEGCHYLACLNFWQSGLVQGCPMQGL